MGRLRRTRGFSQEELGFQAGIHRTYVSQIERGIKSPTLVVILKLAQALGRPASQLIAEVEKQLKK
uniref:helix-turn-helix domain-containing protein n=1 Tax=Nitrospira cf. moscoviensis SBR1015 TaxID=96242 RepID=UPI000B3BC490|nr:helix-turn-helix transcriptional regulator [Nitrospira cf. moscoviensis SBR1015]